MNKKKSTKRVWSAWGDWIWSTTHRRYYSQRQDQTGHIETRWGPSYAEDTPRWKDDEVEDLAEAFSGTHLEDEDGLDEEDQSSPNYSYIKSDYPSHYSTGDGGSSSKKTSKKDSRKKSIKGKEKVGYDEEDEQEQDDDAPYTDGPDDGDPHLPQEQDDDELAEVDPRQQYGQSPHQFSPLPTSSRHPMSGGYYSDGEDADDAQLAAALNASRGYYGPGESSSSNLESPYVIQYDEARPQSNQTGLSTEQTDYISGYEHQHDLDPRYRIEPSHRFLPGAVFIVLWPEPAGRNAGRAISVSDKRAIPDRYGGHVFVGFRRFIVVANDAGHCTCVPILTYGGKGCKKKGIKPEKHGIITERGVKSKRLDGEPKLGFPTIRMRLSVEGERLQRESRVNYSKIVTVEHNVKVRFIGYVTDEDYELVVDAVNKCWEQKTFSNNNSRRSH